MLVIGVDVHKSTHALAAVNAATGQLLGEREVIAREQGHLEALRWAHNFEDEIVWAIEDCRDRPHDLEQALIAAGERVLRVAPKLMGTSRRGERESGKFGGDRLRPSMRRDPHRTDRRCRAFQERCSLRTSSRRRSRCAVDTIGIVWIAVATVNSTVRCMS